MLTNPEIGLTAEQVKKELEEFEASYRAVHRERARRRTATKVLYGADSAELKAEQDDLTALEDYHSRRGRKLRALLAVLEEEAGQLAKGEGDGE